MLGRKSLVVLVARVLASVLALVGLMFTSRYLGPEVNGQISWALALITTFNAMSDFGFMAAHIKRVSEGKDIDDCVSTFTTIKLALTGGMVVFTLGYILIWTAIEPGRLTSTDVYILMLFVLYSVFYNISSIFWTTYEGRMEAVKSQLLTLAEPLSRTPLMILVAVGGLGAVPLAYTYVVGGIVIAVVGIALISRENIHWKKPTLFRDYLKYALPISFITVFGTVSWNLDKLVIEAFESTTDVAFFSQPQTLLGVVGFIGIAVTTMTFPAFSQMHHRGDIEGIRRVTRDSERYISMLAMPVTVVIALFPMETVVTFLGELYAPAAEPMRILAIATYISLLSQAYTPQMGGTNRPDISAKLVGLALLCNIVLLLVFVPTTFMGVQMLGMGVNGAAWVNVIVSLVFMLLVRVIVWRLTQTRSNPRILLHVAAGVLSGLVLYLVFQFYPIQQWYDLLFYGLLEIPVFAGLMWLFRELTRFDVQYFLEVMNLKDMASYISDEMKNKRR
ncbi:MAG: flippase [Methanomassiliicoccales archaeon]|nr:flippase [Methanomassiliicoccales archaeon]